MLGVVFCSMLVAGGTASSACRIKEDHFNDFAVKKKPEAIGIPFPSVAQKMGTPLRSTRRLASLLLNAHIVHDFSGPIFLEPEIMDRKLSFAESVTETMRSGSTDLPPRDATDTNGEATIA